MGNTSTILLNGRQYDAITGRLLGGNKKHSEESKEAKSNHSHSQPVYASKSIDGFFKPKEAAQYSTINKSVEHSSAKPKSHHVAPNSKRHIQPTRTLMRAAVKKPATAKSDIPKVKTHPGYIDRLSSLTKQTLQSLPSSETAEHAKEIPKSPSVNKFNDVSAVLPRMSGDIAKVKPVQTYANSKVQLQNLEKLQAQAEGKVMDRDVFAEAALKLATSHQAIPHKRRHFYDILAEKLHIKTRSLLIIMLVVLILAITSLLTYGHINNINMYLADARTGEHGMLPSYNSPGFKLQKLSYLVGSGNSSILLNYTSNSDQRNYTITESQSNWDSQSLIVSVIQPAVGNNYQSLQIGGRSVYIYGGKYTVWVAGGIYYRIINNATLSDSEIEQIVNST